MREVYNKFGYLIDPHGAVGYQALKYLNNRSLSEKSFNNPGDRSSGKIFGYRVTGN